MALDRLISIKVDNDAAQKKLDKLLSTLKQFDNQMAGTGSSGSGGATKASKPLKQYSGVMSDLARDIAKTNGAISKQEAALVKYDNAVRNAKKNLDQSKYSQKEYNDAIAESKKRYDDRIAAINKTEGATKAGRKTLISYTGALENETRLLQQATGNLSYADAATLRYDTAVRKLNKSAAEGGISQKALANGLAQAEIGYQKAYKGATDLDTALAKGRGGFRAMRGAVSQLSYQFQDIAVQAQMGTAATTIFTQQFPQIASVFGPAGAVVGVIGAIAGAISGPLITSMFGADDAAKKLEKTIESLDKTLEETESGSYRLSDSFYQLGESSKQAQTLQLALAQFKSVDALNLVAKDIERNTNSISTSFFGLFDDIDIKELSDDLDFVSNSSIKNLQQYKKEIQDPLRIDAKAAKTLTERNRIIEEGSVKNRQLKKTLDSLGEAADTVSDKFGLSSSASQDLLEKLNAARINPSVKSFDNLDGTLSKLLKGITDGKKRKAFAEFAEGMLASTEAGRKLNAQAKTLRDGPFGDLEVYIDNTQLANAALNSEFDKTSAVMVRIAEEQRRINDLVKAGAANTTTGQFNLDQNVVKIIGEMAAEYDTIEKRQEAINNLKMRNVVLTDEELASINKYAQSQNFVYEKQLDYNNSLKENSKILGEIFGQGAKDYAKSVGSYNTSLQGLVSSTFSSMEDALVSWAATGKSAFKDFAKSVLEDLLRIQIQQSLAGLASGISGAFGGGSTADSGGSYFNTSSAVTSAKGNAFTNDGLTKYAKGGITGMANTIQSTPKRFANGSGLLGEAGQSEGIFPLTRTSGGDLGVKAVGGSSPMSVNVNIVNESGSEMQFEQTGQSTGSDGSLNIDMVAKMVNRVISSGKADRSITNRFTTRKAVN